MIPSDWVKSIMSEASEASEASEEGEPLIE